MVVAMTDYTLEPPDTPDSAPSTPRKVPIRDLIRHLEGSRDDAVSPAGAIGRYQIMPATARRLGFDPARLKDPAYNEQAMTAAVADLATQYPGDDRAMIVGYNASPKVVQRWLASGRNDAVLPAETRHYLARANALEGGDAPASDSGYVLEPPAKPAAKPAARPDPSAPAASSVPAHPILDTLANVPKDIGHQFMEAGRANVAEANARPSALRDAPMLPGGMSMRQANMGVNALAQLASPITGAAEALVGRPVANVANAINDKFHIMPGMEADPEAIGNLASMVIPGAGEVRGANTLKSAAKEAGVSERTLAANRAATETLPRSAQQSRVLQAQLASRDPAYTARINRLHNQGVEMTSGQIKGGDAKIAEQQSTSSRYKGQAVRDAQQRSLESYNRAGYNEALAPIGERYDPKGPVGRDAIDQVARRIGAVYDRILPQARLKRDPETAEQISEILEQNEELLGPHKGALNAIVKNYILSRLDADGGMDGKTFKLVESDLSGLSHDYRSGRGSEKILSDAIDQINDVLRANMERNSPPGIRQQLRQANTAWATYKRIEGASQQRPTSLGVFTPGDLERNVVKGARNGPFARGNALMSQFADDGQAVLGNIVPDSGTAGRLNRTRSGVAGAVVGDVAGHALGGGPIGGAAGAMLGAAADRQVGGVTNTLAAHLLRREAQTALGRATTPRNYLRAAEQRALAHRAPMIAGGAAQAGQQQ